MTGRTPGLPFQVNRGALKFLYVRVLKQAWFGEEITAPKKRPRLPTVMSPEEIAGILDRTTNLKHWTILATFYATAIRCNELRHLKLSDLDSQKMVRCSAGHPAVRSSAGAITNLLPVLQAD